MMNVSHNKTLTLGVDTHLDLHVAVLIDSTGKLIDTSEFVTNFQGYNSLLKWCKSFGNVIEAGIEGTGSYGAGLCSFLEKQGVKVYEVNRPNRAKRRLVGKSDTTDAENAARSALSKEFTATPKSHDGIVETLRYLLVIRRSTIKARTQAINQIRSLLVTAPDNVREICYQPSPCKCIEACFNLTSDDKDILISTLVYSLKMLAERWNSLTKELKAINKKLNQLTQTTATNLMDQFGIGPYVAATLLVTAGDNPERLCKESSFAALCGVSPLQASSGKTVRHRLNRGGARCANNALWTITLIRMRGDPKTKKYVEKRTSQGLSQKEIQRCLKRYIARELYPIIVSDLSKFT